MSTHGESGVPTPSGIPAIVFACALGVPAAGFLGLFGSIGAGLGGLFTLLTVPLMLLAGACLGGGLGGLVALFCRFHLRRGFCYLFGAAIGAIIGTIVMIVSEVFILPSGAATRALPCYDSYQLLKDAIALGVIFLGGWGGAAMQRFVTRFGAKARAWAWIGTGGSAGAAFPLMAALVYISMKADDAKFMAQNPNSGGHEPGYLLSEALTAGLFWAVIAALSGGCIGALAGAIRDSAVPQPKDPKTADTA